MSIKKKRTSPEVLKFLPSVDRLLRSATAVRIFGENAGGGGVRFRTNLARRVTEALRNDLLAEIAKEGGGENFETENYSRESLLKEAEFRLEKAWKTERRAKLQKVINASGVIVHTNLGRAPLSDAARRAMHAAARYGNLEYDLETGERGRRGAEAERLLAEAAGAEAALIVNNCAAAAILVLSTLGRGGEAIVSRGELVEIGGDFRVPDVMNESGARLVEVGTTNKTRAADYEKACTENTRLIVKVHPSNYRIIGFTSTPSIAELSEVARRAGVLLYEDAGSGALFDMSAGGLPDEPVIGESIRAGADVVTFSGDKLLGGIQSGLIVGRGEVIERLRKNPLYRALRVSKIVYAVLEATLEAFRRETALEEIPVLKMISTSRAESKKRLENFLKDFSRKSAGNSALDLKIVASDSVVGGGSAPGVSRETDVLALGHEKLSADELEQKLRGAEPPVIARIFEKKVLLDLRTVFEDEEAELLEILLSIAAGDFSAEETESGKG